LLKSLEKFRISVIVKGGGKVAQAKLFDMELVGLSFFLIKILEKN
jgi:ribosomal protein S9